MFGNLMWVLWVGTISLWLMNNILIPMNNYIGVPLILMLTILYFGTFGLLLHKSEKLNDEIKAEKKRNEE